MHGGTGTASILVDDRIGTSSTTKKKNGKENNSNGKGKKVKNSNRKKETAISEKYELLSNRGDVFFKEMGDIEQFVLGRMKRTVASVIGTLGQKLRQQSNQSDIKRLSGPELFENIFFDQLTVAWIRQYTDSSLFRNGFDPLKDYELYGWIGIYWLLCTYRCSPTSLYFGKAYAFLKKSATNPCDVMSYARFMEILRNIRAWDPPIEMNDFREIEALREFFAEQDDDDSESGENEDDHEDDENEDDNKDDETENDHNEADHGGTMLPTRVRSHIEQGTEAWERHLNDRFRLFIDKLNSLLVCDDDHLRMDSIDLESELIFKLFCPGKGMGPVLDIICDQASQCAVGYHLRKQFESATDSMKLLFRTLANGNPKPDGTIKAFFNGDREYTSLYAMQTALAYGCDTVDTTRRDSNFSALKELPFWFRTSRGSRPPNANVFEVRKHGAQTVYVARRVAKTVEEDINTLFPNQIISNDEKAELVDRVQELLFFAIREGMEKNPVLMWGKSRQMDLAKTWVYESSESDCSIPDEIKNHAIMKNVVLLTYKQHGREWHYLRKFRVTSTTAQKLKTVDLQKDSKEEVIARIFNASMMKPISKSSRQSKTMAKGTKAEPILRSNVKDFFNTNCSRSNVKVLSIIQDEMGLVHLKGNEHIAASVDFIGEIEIESKKYPLIGEIKTAAKQSTEQEAHTLANGLESTIVCNAFDDTFKKCIPDSYQTQMLQGVTACGVRHCLYVRGDDDGQVLYCVLVKFSDADILKHKTHLDKIFSKCMDFLYEKNDLSGLQMRKQILWDKLPSGIRFNNYTGDSYTIDCALTLSHFMAIKVREEQAPFSYCTRLLMLVQTLWNKLKGAVD